MSLSSRPSPRELVDHHRMCGEGERLLGADRRPSQNVWGGRETFRGR